MGEALWTGLEILAFCLLVAGAVGLFGPWWALVVAGVLLGAVVVWRAIAVRGVK